MSPSVTAIATASDTAFSKPLHYPPVRRDETVVDDYFGVKVADPYRWVEDPDSEETKQFVQDQVKLANSVLEECDYIDKIRKKTTDYVNFPRCGVPFKRGGKFFHFYNSGLQAQNVLHMQDDLDGKAEVIYDPNLHENGRSGLHVYSVSDDAKYLAFGIALGLTEWVTIKVMNILERKMEPDTLSWVKFSGLHWSHDNKGFFYCPYPPRDEAIDDGTNTTTTFNTNSSFNQMACYHFLGTDQSEDILCWRDPENPGHNFKFDLTSDGKFLILYTLASCAETNKVYIMDLTTLPNGLEGFRGKQDLLPFTKLIDSFDAQYTAISNDGSVFTFQTNKDAPRNKIVRVDLNNPHVWTDVVQQSEKDLLESAHAVNGNQLFVRYLSDVKHVLEVRDLESGSLLHRIPLDIGAVSGINAQREDTVVFFKFTSFLTPGIIYQCDLKNDVPQLKIFKESVVSDFDRSEFEVNQVFYPTKDGTTKIPMFIVSKKGIVLDGSHPCELHGYGGFKINLMPTFSASRIVFLKHLGGVFCLPNIRGGGEYGDEWHKAGMLDKKQNVFDDFITAAEYLISKGYTQPKKLAIEGGSNGGLLVAACITQRPDLYGCAMANCGVMDMLRYHKFTLGYLWTADYGCADNEEDFKYLIEYSPLHKVRRPWEQSQNQQIQYPATMILAADHDDRVVPLHSFKFLATMQYVLCTSLENSPQKNPIIARIECKASHCGRATMKQINEVADRYGFLAKSVKASWID